MAKIYLAHNYSAKPLLRVIIDLITEKDHQVTSRWIIWDESELKNEPDAVNATIDIADIDSAEYLIGFIDQLGQTPGRGKFFEIGYAYAKGKKIILVGDSAAFNDSVFYHLAGIQKVNKLGSALAIIATREYAKA